MAMWKKDPLEEYDNQLGKIQQEKLDLKNRIKELDALEIDVLKNRKDMGLRMYMKAEKREKLLSEAEELGYSHKVIEDLRNFSKDWNQDNVTNELINEFKNVELYIKKNAPHRKNLLYLLGCVTNDRGGNEDDN